MLAQFCFFVFLLLPYQSELSGDEQSEYGTYYFFYAPYTHNFYVMRYEKYDVYCYVGKLTSNELLAVHTDDGLRAIEVKMLSLVDHATPVESRQLDQQDVRACNGANRKNHTLHFFKLN